MRQTIGVNEVTLRVGNIWVGKHFKHPHHSPLLMSNFCPSTLLDPSKKDVCPRGNCIPVLSASSFTHSLTLSLSLCLDAGLIEREIATGDWNLSTVEST